jgi:hypothetical protein
MSHSITVIRVMGQTPLVYRSSVLLYIDGTLVATVMLTVKTN